MKPAQMRTNAPMERTTSQKTPHRTASTIRGFMADSLHGCARTVKRPGVLRTTGPPAGVAHADQLSGSLAGQYETATTSREFDQYTTRNFSAPGGAIVALDSGTPIRSGPFLRASPLASCTGTPKPARKTGGGAYTAQPPTRGPAATCRRRLSVNSSSSCRPRARGPRADPSTCSRAGLTHVHGYAPMHANARVPMHPVARTGYVCGRIGKAPSWWARGLYGAARGYSVVQCSP